MLKKLNLKQRFLLIFLGIGLIPVVLTAMIALQQFNATSTKVANEKLEALRSVRKGQIKDYFNIIAEQVRTFSDDRMIIDAMKEFTAAGEQMLSSDNKVNFDEKKFAARYTYQMENTTNASNTDKKNWMNLDPLAKSLQQLYVSGNPKEIGAKEALEDAGDGSDYSKVHKKYHPHIRHYLQSFGFYDIFLVEPKTGRVIYSVFKEVDYATSLKNGPYADSNFAKAFQKAAVATDRDEVFLVDFENYAPSYGAPASFIASPIFETDGTKVGVLVFQMPVDEINRIMGGREGLGETGETYLIGHDHKMRSSSPLAAEGVSTLGNQIESDVIEHAFDGGAGLIQSDNYLGYEALS